MIRKEKDVNYIYKTTCNITGRYYIGMHSTNNENDGYLGSGLQLRRSIRKYGADYHIKEILEYCTNRKELSVREKEIVTLEIVSDDLCMNLRIGGEGGFISIEQQRHRSECGGKAFAERLKNDEEFSKIHSKLSSERIKKTHNEGKFKYDNFKNKNHSEQTKALMSQSSKGIGVGETNSQFGTCWITRDGLNKKVKKEDIDQWISDGWLKGRK